MEWKKIMNIKTTFYIARHGETEKNVQHIIQGHQDSPLTEAGINQAYNLAKKLRKIKFDAVFSSDILRAKRTAQIVAKEKKLEVEATEMLRERNWGKLEGQPSTDYNSAYKDLVESLSHEERYIRELVPGFESDEKMMQRLIPFLRETALANPGKKILVISHGTIIRTFLIHLGYGNYQNLRGGAIDNAGYIVVESDGVEFFVKETHGVHFVEETDHEQ